MRVAGNADGVAEQRDRLHRYGFVEAGVPLGVTFAFLISSPMVNEVALVMLWGLFGPGIALAFFGSIAFSGKAIIVKLAYRHGVDAVTLIAYRMLFALPLFVVLSGWAGRGCGAARAAGA